MEKIKFKTTKTGLSSKETLEEFKDALMVAIDGIEVIFSQIENDKNTINIEASYGTNTLDFVYRDGKPTAVTSVLGGSIKGNVSKVEILTNLGEEILRIFGMTGNLYIDFGEGETLENIRDALDD